MKRSDGDFLRSLGIEPIRGRSPRIRRRGLNRAEDAAAATAQRIRELEAEHPSHGLLTWVGDRALVRRPDGSVKWYRVTDI